MLRVSEIKETGGNEQTPANSVKTFLKIGFGGRQPVSSERKIIEDRGTAVSSFLEEIGHELPNRESILERAVIVPRKKMSSLGKAVKTRGVGSFLILRDDVVRNPRKHTTIDHELLHNSQSPHCPKGLVEGITTLYQRRLAKRDGLRMGYIGPYLFDEAYCRILERMVGKEALASLNFLGDTSVLKSAFENEIDYKHLIKSIHKLQHGQEMYSASLSANPLKVNYLAQIASLFIKLDALADIISLSFGKRK